MRPRIRITIRKTLLTWSAIGVISLLAIALSALHASRESARGQDTLVDVGLQLESAGRRLNANTATFIARQNHILGARQLPDLQALLPLQPLIDQYGELRNRLQAISDDFESIAPPLARMDAAQDSLVTLDAQLLAATRDSLQARQELQALALAIETTIGDMRNQAQAIAGKINLRSTLQKRRIGRQLDQAQTSDQLRDSVRDYLFGATSTVQQQTDAIRLASVELLALLRELIHESDPDSLNSLRGNRVTQVIASLGQALNGLDGSLQQQPKLAAALQSLDQHYTQLRQALLGETADTAFALRRRQVEIDRRLRATEQASVLAAQQLAEAVGELGQVSNQIVAATLARTEDVRSTTDALILATSGSGIALTLALGLVATRRITQQINRAARALKEIADGDGDLRSRLVVSGQDEIAELSANFNTFVARIQSLIQQISTTADGLGGAAERLTGISNQTSESVQQQQTATENMVIAIEQMDTTVRAVAESAASAAHAAEEGKQQALSGRSSVHDNVNAIESLSAHIGASTQVIEQLGEESNAIGSILDVIRGIADQTNLLALNAAIEAARAGEQGRGFSVVADEVRNLARRTQESTDQIQTLIIGLQDKTGEAVEAMRSGRSGAETTVTEAKNLAVVLETISDAISTISEMNYQIASATEQQTSATAELRGNVSEISTLAQSASTGAIESRSSVGGLVQHVELLRKLVARFTVA